jgi:hypothetical protein
VLKAVSEAVASAANLPLQGNGEVGTGGELKSTPAFRKLAVRLSELADWVNMARRGVSQGYWPLVIHLQPTQVNSESVAQRIESDVQRSLRFLSGDAGGIQEDLTSLVRGELREFLALANRSREREPNPEWLQKLSPPGVLDLQPFTATEGGALRSSEHQSVDAGGDGGQVVEALAPGYRYKGEVLLKALVRTRAPSPARAERPDFSVEP